MNLKTVSLSLLACTAFLTGVAAQNTTLPQRFTANEGQWSEVARFHTKRSGAAAWFVDGGWRVRFAGEAQSAVFDMQFVGSRAMPTPEDWLPGVTHFLVGPETAWRRDVPAAARLRYRKVAKGIDVLVREGDGVLFEFEAHVAPGSKVSDFVVECRGIDRLRVNANGSLAMRTAIGEIVQTAPKAWTLDGGTRQKLVCRYVLHGTHRFGFLVPGWDGRSPLVIDPGLVYSTYFGGNGSDWARDVTVNAAGETLLLGDTSSTNFPTTTGAYKSKIGGTDVFLTLLAADGKKLVASTLLGGSAVDVSRDVHLARNGDFVVCGETQSTDFPVTKGAVQVKHAGGGYDAFVARVTKDGKSLVFATFLGGSRFDQAGGVHINAIDEVTVAGTGTAGFPTTKNAFQTKLPSGNNFFNPFVSRLAKDGKSFVYSSFLGGTNFGSAYSVFSDLRGNVTVVGQSGSKDFPVTKGAFQTKGNLGINFNGFVARLGANGKPTWATYLGGAGMNRVTSVHVDAKGITTVAGWTKSSNFPVTKTAIQWRYGGHPSGFSARGDGFVSKLDTTGSKLLASTYLGGGGDDEIHRVFVDPTGNVTVCGNTGSNDFPLTTGCLRNKFYKPPFPSWEAEAFVTRFNSDLSERLYSTYFGGTNLESGTGIHFDPDTLVATLSGRTSSTAQSFPISKTNYQATLSGAYDSYVAKIQLLPFGIERLGTPTPCTGALTLEPSGYALQKSTSFKLHTAGAPANASGGLLLSFKPVPNGVKLPPPLGAVVYVDLNAAILFVAKSSAAGTHLQNTSLANVPAGARGWVQSFWLNPIGVCNKTNALSMSMALDVTVLR